MLKRIPEPVRIVSRPVLGLAAPSLRRFVRGFPDGPAKRFLWSTFGEKIAFGSWPFVTETIFGFRIAAETGDMISRYLYYFGVWEPNISAWMRSVLGPGDGFVDVGANLGYYSLLASQLVGPSGVVVAIEASPGNFKKLRRNIVLNAATNVREVAMAVLDVEGEVELFAASRGNRGMNSILRKPGFSLEARVRAKPLPAIVTPHELGRARIVKIDVEGAEWAVVSGLVGSFDAMRADVELIVEVSPKRLAEIGKTPADIVAVFSRGGFHAYTIANDYRTLGYMAPFRYEPPERLAGDIHVDTDVIFSRRDVARL